MPDLAGRIALVTGTAHGIGAGIAAALDAHGATVHGVEQEEVESSGYVPLQRRRLSVEGMK